MEKIDFLIITQARYGSTRLPGKVLENVVNDITILQLHLKRIKRSENISKICVALADEPNVQNLIEVCLKEDVEYYIGDESDVLDRFYKASNQFLSKYIIRVTSDCPLIDHEVIDKLINICKERKLDYCSNTILETYPDGLDVEIFTKELLEKTWKSAFLKSDREHVTSLMRRELNDPKINILKRDLKFYNLENSDHRYLENVRMTVDEKEDLNTIRKLCNAFGLFSNWKTYAQYIYDNPEHFINQNIIRNEGYLKSINDE